MFNIDYFEDYDITGDGSLNTIDMQTWRSIGRYDIVNLIQGMMDGTVPIPPNDPGAGYMGEYADELMVSMSFQKEFYYEDQVVGQDEEGNDIIKPVWEGYEQLTKTSLNSVNYFGETKEGNISHLSGSVMSTSSMDDKNKLYYYGITDGDPDLSKTQTHFHVAFGHYAGSGSDTHNGNRKGPSEAIYKQYASMLLDYNQMDKGFLISSGSDVSINGQDGNRDDFIYILNFKQSKFKDQLQTGNWTLRLSGSINKAATEISLTDDSIARSIPPKINKLAGREFNIVSGSAGTTYGIPSNRKDKTHLDGRYGLFYPDIGIMVLGEKIASKIKSGSRGNGDNMSPTPAFHDSITSTTFAAGAGLNQLHPTTSSAADGKNALLLANALHRVDGPALTLYGEKETTDKYFACRVSPGEFNFTNNPTIISSSGRSLRSNEPGRMNEFSGSGGFTMAGNPNTYVGQVSLYNQYGMCVAIAKLNKPLQNNFEKELVIKVKLSF
jgi:hypothetical protein